MKKFIDILRGLEIFGMLTDDEIEKISSIANEVSYKRGAVIIKENTLIDSLFIIKKGCVRVTKDGQLIVILGEGNTVGELSFIDKGMTSATVTAEEDSLIIEIPSSAVEGLMAVDKEIAVKLYKSFALSLCQKLRDTNEWLFTKDWLKEIEKEVSRKHLHI